VLDPIAKSPALLITEAVVLTHEPSGTHLQFEPKYQQSFEDDSSRVEDRAKEEGEGREAKFRRRL
jgi:hypothetical protein